MLNAIVSSLSVTYYRTTYKRNKKNLTLLATCAPILAQKGRVASPLRAAEQAFAAPPACFSPVTTVLCPASPFGSSISGTQMHLLKERPKRDLRRLGL